MAHLVMAPSGAFLLFFIVNNQKFTLPSLTPLYKKANFASLVTGISIGLNPAIVPGCECGDENEEFLQNLLQK